METRANYVRVGIFTLVVLALAVGFTYWSVFSSSGDNRVPLLVRIEGSVTGLQQGSQVLFNGLPVGQVTALRIDNNNPGVVIATTMVDPTIPIKENTQANIGFQGLTGYAFVELKGGDPTGENLIDEARQQGVTPVIRANPSDVTDILATARDIADRANTILGEFESIVKDAGPGVQTTVANVAKTSENVETFTAALARNTDNIDSFVDSLSALTVSARNVADALPSAIQQAQDILAAVDTDEIGQIVGNVTQVTANVREGSERIGSVMDSVQSAANGVGKIGDVINQNADGIDRFIGALGPFADTATSVATQLGTTLQGADQVIAAVDPAKVSTTLDGVSQTATNVAALSQRLNDQSEAIDTIVQGASNAVANVETVTKAVADRREEIDQTLANLAPLSDTANRVANRLDVTLQNADRVVAAVDPAKVSQTLDQVTAAATNVASLTEAVDQQKEAISSAISGFANSAQNVNRLTTTVAQRSGEIDQALANLGPISDQVGQAATSLNETLGSARQVVAAIDPAKVQTTLDGASTTATNAAALSQKLSDQSEAIDTIVQGASNAVTNVEQVTKTVADRRQDIDQAIANIAPLTETANRVANSLDTTLQNADRVVAAVDPEKVATAVDSFSSAAANVASVSETVNQQKEAISSAISGFANSAQNVNQITTTVAQRVDAIDQLLASLGPISTNVSQASTKLNSTLDSAKGVVDSLDTAMINKSIDNVGAITDAVREKTPEIQSIVERVNSAVLTIDGAVKGFSETRAQLDTLLASIDPGKVNQAVENVSAATDNVARAADSIAGVATDIGAKRPQIDSIIENVQATSDSLKTASAKIDGVLTSIDGVFAGAGNGTQLGSDLAGALQSVRGAAQSIQEQVTPISANLQRFSSQGLQDFQSLMRSLSRTVDRIDDAVADFSTNPSRILYGGDDVKQYDGRTRR
ncbi:MlaD family protein [Jiella pelagia]|uniref:MlaD family protein n=1 Tax=Jiella pelagia TaxID=2986949 RepID=A0ABY7BY89_9HYPH|nr:MlaD family protein [Jiella pelagia]WAP68804.1 MlaD family protein [Jiella pelagia]